MVDRWTGETGGWWTGGPVRPVAGGSVDRWTGGPVVGGRWDRWTVHRHRCIHIQEEDELCSKCRLNKFNQ
jgi:hypothetical protein